MRISYATRVRVLASILGLSAIPFSGCEILFIVVSESPPPVTGGQYMVPSVEDVNVLASDPTTRVTVLAFKNKIVSMPVRSGGSVHTSPRFTVDLPGVVTERLYFATITPGTVDLVIQTTTGILYLEGNPDGSFGPTPKTIYTGELITTNAESLAFADVDKDGDIDVIAGGSNPAATPPHTVQVRVFKNNGTGNFTNSHTLQLPDGTTTAGSLASGDLNNDGYPEFSIGSNNAHFLTMTGTDQFRYFSTTTGIPQSNPTTPIDSGLGKCILSDLNGDGRSEFIYTRSNGGIGIRFAQADGSLGPVQIHPGIYGSALYVGDFNGDGHKDIATHGELPAKLSVYYGQPGGMIGAPVVVDAPGNAFRLGFFTPPAGTNEHAAFYTVHRMSEMVQTYISLPEGPLTSDRRSLTDNNLQPVQASDALIADVNGDTYPDLITSSSSDLGFSLNTGDGSGNFLTNKTDRVASLAAIAAMPPVDGQGDARDVIAVAVNNSTTAAVVRLNSATNPTDWIAFSIFSLPQVGVDVAAGDINGDGRADLVYSHTTGSAAFTTVLQQPGGTFLVGPSVNVSGGAWSRIFLADLNGANGPDVILGDSTTGAIRTLVNNGSGGFAPVAAGSISLPPSLSLHAATGDFNNDGVPDVVIGVGPSGPSLGSVRVLYGDGAAGFSGSKTIETIRKVASVAIGDINGDGIDDVCFAASAPSTLPDGNFGIISGTPAGSLTDLPTSYHYINGNPVAALVVDLKSPIGTRARSSNRPVGLVVGVPPVYDEGLTMLDPAPTLESCAGDLNNDGFVDDADFSFFVVAYNILDCADPSMPASCPSDFNNDGMVEDADFSIFVVAYNEFLCP